MNYNRKPVEMVEAGLLTALAVVFTVIGVFIPFLGVFLSLVAVPLTILGIRRGYKYLGLSIVSSGILAFLIGGLVTGFYVMFVGGLASFGFTYLINKKASVSKTVMIMSIISIFAISVSFQIAITISGIDFFSILDSSISESMDMMSGLMTNEEQKAIFIESMENTVDTVKLMFPSTLVISGVFFSIINVFVIREVMKRIGYKVPSLGKFNEFRYEKNVIFGASIIIILSYLSAKLNIVDTDSIFLNVIFVIAFAFSVQGVSVLDHFFDKRGVKKFMRAFLVVILFFLFEGVIFFGILGWFDVIFNFRKLDDEAVK